MRKHSLREDAFKSPVDEDAAYWAGFLLADGCVSHRSGSPELHLSLAEVDRGHVEKFKAFLGSGHKIRRVCPKLRDGDFKSGPSVRFHVRSKRLVSDLAALGVSKRKTHTAIVCRELNSNRHTWRGVVDGDGAVFRRSVDRPEPVLDLCGSLSTMQQFSLWCWLVLGGESPPSVLPIGRIFRVKLTGIKARTVIGELYRDCSVSLDRKKTKSEELLKWQPKRFEGLALEARVI